MHPLKRDRFRGFMVETSLSKIILIYIVFTLSASLLFSFISVLLTGKKALFLDYLYGFTYSLLGNGTAGQLNQFAELKWLALLSSLTFVINTTILLGAVVYKVTIPKKNLMIFRDKVELDAESGELKTSFYSSTLLTIYRLKTSCFIKWYQPYFEDKSENLFPMNVFEVNSGDRLMPVPYNFIPTGVIVPVAVIQNLSQLDAKRPLTIHTKPNDQYDIYINGQNAKQDEHYFCRLYIMVEGCTPQAPGNILEVHEYDLFTQLSLQQSLPFESRFNIESNQYTVKKWYHF